MFFLHSEDFQSGGTSSDGVWTFNRNLKGNWSVIGQHMDAQDIPWLFPGQNDMVMRIHDPLDDPTFETFTISFPTSVGLLTNPDLIGAAIATTIQNRINEIAVLSPYAARTITYSGSDTATQTMVFVFDVDPVDLLWRGDPDAEMISTINPSFDKVGALNELAVGTMTLSYVHMITDPKYLEVYIAESSSNYSTGHGTFPNLLFSTRDGEFTNQQLSIPNNTNKLTINICRMGETNPVLLSGAWYVIFIGA